MSKCGRCFSLKHRPICWLDDGYELKAFAQKICEMEASALSLQFKVHNIYPPYTTDMSSHYSSSSRL